MGARTELFGHARGIFGKFKERCWGTPHDIRAVPQERFARGFGIFSELRSRDRELARNLLLVNARDLRVIDDPMERIPAPEEETILIERPLAGQAARGRTSGKPERLPGGAGCFFPNVFPGTRGEVAQEFLGRMLLEQPL